MAFESAHLATEALVSYGQGKAGWPATTAAVADTLEKAFTPRLRWAARFHRALFCGPVRDAVAPLVLGNAWGWNRAFAATRY
jgi:hypothetical protein